MEHGAGNAAETPSPKRSEHTPRCEGLRVGVGRGFVQSAEPEDGTSAGAGRHRRAGRTRGRTPRPGISPRQWPPAGTHLQGQPLELRLQRLLLFLQAAAFPFQLLNLQSARRARPSGHTPRPARPLLQTGPCPEGGGVSRSGLGAGCGRTSVLMKGGLHGPQLEGAGQMGTCTRPVLVGPLPGRMTTYRRGRRTTESTRRETWAGEGS